MTARRRNWVVAIFVTALLLATGLAVAASHLAKRLEPQARQEAIRYLSQRFDADVQLEGLHIRLPRTSPLHLLLTRGRGISARVEGQNLSVRLHKPATAPLFVIRKFSGEVSLESLLHPPVVVSQISIEGMGIHVPPRSNPPLQSSSSRTEPPSVQSVTKSPVIFQSINIRDATLVLEPSDPQKLPLTFAIKNLLLTPGTAGVPIRYQASLTNAKPPGEIKAKGTFGPWQADEPGGTPITGDYVFEGADLGVFAGIAGTLASTGRFEGRLSALTVHGQASVPNFQLRIAGNPVPLFTRFTALVDGTNGNTVLQPVEARLGSTNFTTSGGVIRHQANQRRAVSLDVAMPNGNLRDVLRLAMKGDPFMEGRLVLNTKIEIPPLTGKVREKLVLDGRFEVHDGKFLHSTIQTQIDNLSRRAQGHSKRLAADTGVSHMNGEFHLENAAIRFRTLSFGVPGAVLKLVGEYDLDSDALDFDGSVRLQATVSQLVTGWKRIVLRPVDPFFEKRGAGTSLRIQIDGTSKAPNFGFILAGRRLEAPLSKRRE